MLSLKIKTNDLLLETQKSVEVLDQQQVAARLQLLGNHSYCETCCHINTVRLSQKPDRGFQGINYSTKIKSQI
ncbi:hypothetical protein COO91_11103 (plasmid) [Nostoc flagelliforme CCNUN1]|uniref:Uncharacterized protein n=1 Tax=Nostoc flagelliforme CCNUN1 TaxID=2038116 RepID=A0A2K8TB01_9NOSO|nr:hypothetical protein COO91_11103 [Nostoc flagelliforme CCNUN1]